MLYILEYLLSKHLYRMRFAHIANLLPVALWLSEWKILYHWTDDGLKNRPLLLVYFSNHHKRSKLIWIARSRAQYRSYMGISHFPIFLIMSPMKFFVEFYYTDHCINEKKECHLLLVNLIPNRTTGHHSYMWCSLSIMPTGLDNFRSLLRHFFANKLISH